MNVFKHFKIFICFFIICFFCFSIVDYSKPKEVKALAGIDDLAIPLVAGGTVLGPGAIVVLGVVAAAGIALCNEDVRDFVTDCGTYCYDELSKIKATYDESLNGINAELTPSLVEKVLEFAKSKEGTTISLEDDFNFVGSSLDLPFKFSQGQAVWKDLCSFTVNKDCSIVPRAYCSGTDSISALGLYGNSVSFSSGDVVSFKYAWDISGSYYYMVNLYKNGNYVSQAYQGYGNYVSKDYLSLDFLLRVDTSLILEGSFQSFLSKSFTYPDITKDGCKSIDEYNDKYKEYTGTNSVCADLTALGGLALDSSVDDVCTALEGTLPVYSDDVIGTSDIPGISIENDGVNTKVDDIPDTSIKDETGVLGSILEWIKSLLLSLFKFLEGLLQKLIDLLKSLLIALFVPSDSFIQEKVDMLKNQLEPKLPYAQYIKLFDNAYEGNELKDIVINIYGQDVVIVKVTLFEHFRNLFNTGVYAVMFFLLAVYNYNNIYKLIRGTDYVSATNTINNATGGTGGSGKGGGD